MRNSTVAAGAALILALTGCTGVVVDDYPGPRWSYYDGDLDYAAHKGAIVTEVHGNPFAMPADRFRDAVLSNMRGQNRGVPADFVAGPSERTIAPYKVVAVFNPVAWADGETLCKGGTGLSGSAPAGGMRLTMAFCFGSHEKSFVAGRVAAASSIDDPAFRSLVRQVTHGLVPAGDNEDQGEGDDVTP